MFIIYCIDIISRNKKKRDYGGSELSPLEVSLSFDSGIKKTVIMAANREKNATYMKNTDLVRATIMYDAKQSEKNINVSIIAAKLIVDASTGDVLFLSMFFPLFMNR